jgi:phospho-N-acetylmuramoyl-pentapeptide-transferase
MKDIVLGEILIAGLASLLISIFLGPKYIQFLRQREFGQHIREEGPEGHHLTKAGTPTMGGLVILTAIAIPYLILSERDAASLAVFGVALASAAIGFADDWLKIVKARSLGLSARTKLFFQLVIALALWYLATHTIGLDDTLNLRIFDAEIDIGAFYAVFVFLVLAGATNGVNLTDGLDGLAGGCCAVVLLTYTAMAFITGPGEGLSGGEREGLALLGACLVGASVGFLWFNSFPAAIFMGDTGSLGLGGAIAGMAVMTKSEVLLIVIGGIFVIEALSVAAQVFTFRTFRRRVLLMAPLHHHFELLGWSENKIIVRFWITTAIFCAIGFTLYQQSVGA